MAKLTKAIMESVDTLGDWLLLNIVLGQIDLVYGYIGQSSPLQCIQMGTRYVNN